MIQMLNSGKWYEMPTMPVTTKTDWYQVSYIKGRFYYSDSEQLVDIITIEQARKVLTELQDYINKKELEQLQVKD